MFARGGLEELVDLLDGGGLLNFETAVGDRGVQERDPDLKAIQAPQKFGEDHADGRCRSSGGRDHGGACRSGPAEVFVVGIDDDLGVGQVVKGGDRSVPDSDPFMDDLDDGRQAVGGA
ncbi:MAG TPA: hypothetical protein PKD76_05660 [Solirubrobacterales bacterium]|nr:hypothetical protein [Solirubrobacterales bacterium]